MFLEEKRLGEPQKPFRIWTATGKLVLVLILAVIGFLVNINAMISKAMGYALVSSACDMLIGACALASIIVGIDMLQESRREVSR